jgi:hypothetical protein
MKLKIYEPRIRKSSIECRKTCARKFLYEYRLGLQRPGYQAALTRGTLFHALIRDAILGKGEELEGAPTAAEHFHWEKQRLRKEGLPTLELSRDWATARAMAQALLPTLQQQLTGKIILVEHTVRCTYLGYRLQGTLDLITDTGRLDLIDWKTTTLPLEQAILPLRWNTHFRLYRVLMEVICRKRKRRAGKFKMIHVRVPGIRLKGNESMKQYVKRVQRWYAEPGPQPKILVSTLQFARKLRHQDMLAEIEEQDWFARHSVGGLEAFPRDVTGRACFAWNRPCPWLSACASNQSVREMIRERRLEQKDPDRYGKDFDITG